MSMGVVWGEWSKDDECIKWEVVSHHFFLLSGRICTIKKALHNLHLEIYLYPFWLVQIKAQLTNTFSSLRAIASIPKAVKSASASSSSTLIKRSVYKSWIRKLLQSCSPKKEKKSSEKK
jgi:hypothetical protein